MKILYVFFLLALSANTFGQKIRFTDRKNNWVTNASGPVCATVNRYYDYDNTDTVIAGISYSHLVNYRNVYQDPFCVGVDFPVYGYYVREDTITNKVYYRNFETGPDVLEHLLYDYNVNVGDTIGYNFIAGHFVDSVTSVSTVVIAGVSHKVINLQNEAAYGRGYYTVIEGLGCTGGPLLPTYYGASFEYTEQLACFSQNSYYPDITVPIQDVFFGDIDTFNNVNSCTELAENNPINPFEVAATIRKTPASISIFPNPTTDIILINASGQNNLDATVIIYDVTGRCMYKYANGNVNGLTINCAEWSSGLYFVIVENSDRILKKEKVVISR